MLGKLHVSKINDSYIDNHQCSSMTESTDQRAHINEKPQHSNLIKNQEQKSDKLVCLHSEFILNGLQILKSNNILCDVVLIAEEKRFHAHKILLASVSDYFRSMFTSGMRESSQNVIELKGVSARGLEKVIEIIYTSRTKFDSYTDIFDVISAANHLQCLLAIDYCETNFLTRLTCANFNYFIHMAKLYRLPNAMKQIELFIVKNFAQIMSQRGGGNKSNVHHITFNILAKNDVNQTTNSLDDCHLSGVKCLSYDQMVSCLKHDQLKIKEIDLFILTWRWINKCLLVSNERIRTKLSKSPTITYGSISSSVKSAIAKASIKRKRYLNIINKKTTNRKVASLYEKQMCLDLNNKVKTESCYMRKIDIIRNLIKNIRFALISPHDIISRVQTVNALMLRDEHLQKIVLNALNYHLMPNLFIQQQHLRLDKAHLTCEEDQTFNLNIRAPIRCVLAFGGREINPYPCLHDTCYLLNDFSSSPISASSNVVASLSSSSSSSSVTKTTNVSLQKATFTSLPFALSHMQTVVIDNFLYVLGGCVSQCAHGESAINSAFRFDPRLSKWTSTASMLEKRAYFYACSLGFLTEKNNTRKEIIYSFGGKNRDGSLCSVEKYDICANEWSYAQSMPTSCYAHAGAVLNNVAYMSGGYMHGHFAAEMFAYVPCTNQWNELRPMHAARGWHSMCVADANLYVFGGCYLANTTHPTNNLGMSSSQHSMHQNMHQIAQPVTLTEFYTPSTDQWTIVKPMVNLHKEASHFLLEHYVYILGGYNIATKTGQRKHLTNKLISRYDIVNDVWQTIGQISNGLTGVGCCILDLPWFLFDAAVGSGTAGCIDLCLDEFATAQQQHVLEHNHQEDASAMHHVREHKTKITLHNSKLGEMKPRDEFTCRNMSHSNESTTTSNQEESNSEDDDFQSFLPEFHDSKETN